MLVFWCWRKIDDREMAFRQEHAKSEAIKWLRGGER
jgi:hypothetical protein